LGSGLSAPNEIPPSPVIKAITKPCQRYFTGNAEFGILICVRTAKAFYRPLVQLLTEIF
jgi:hypothetical protein